jgi:hypothetical protein
VTLYALLSPGGSAGVTTTALALALTWPRPVILAECDPATQALSPSAWSSCAGLNPAASSRASIPGEGLPAATALPPGPVGRNSRFTVGRSASPGGLFGAELTRRAPAPGTPAVPRRTARAALSVAAVVCFRPTLNRSYSAPYGTLAGQIVLALVAALYVAGLAWLHHLGTIPFPGRFLGEPPDRYFGAEAR